VEGGAALSAQRFTAEHGEIEHGEIIGAAHRQK
jgi:hypothetical protein